MRLEEVITDTTLFLGYLDKILSDYETGWLNRKEFIGLISEIRSYYTAMKDDEFSDIE
jgi:hypothetical protein